jgi:hypothetical protein
LPEASVDRVFVCRDLEAAGYQLVAEHRTLPRQSFLEFAPVVA